MDTFLRRQYRVSLSYCTLRNPGRTPQGGNMSATTNPRTTLAIRLPASLKAELGALARATGRNRNALVEAKEEGLAPAAGLQQAKTYAQQLGLLFAYSTNGHGIEEFDFSTQVQQSFAAFPSPEELYQRYSAANRAVKGGVAAETRRP